MITRELTEEEKTILQDEVMKAMRKPLLNKRIITTAEYEKMLR